MKPDRFGKTTNCNVYYDTPDYRLIRTSLEKPVYKEKLRLRSYGPAAPEKEGYVFAGWQIEAENKAYKESTKLSGDTEITARFLKIYTFEAENTQLTDLEDDPTVIDGKKMGYGYSNNVGGLQLIQAEGDSQCNASGGYYVSSLYYNGAYLEWYIYSDREVDDAQLTLRLSSEYYDMLLTSKTFLVLVNPDWEEDAEDQGLTYDDIDLSGAITDLSSLLKRPFKDYLISKTVHLNEGENCICLMVNNSEKQGTTGTMNAAAPMIDCIYVATDAELTWEPFANGL